MDAEELWALPVKYFDVNNIPVPSQSQFSHKTSKHHNLNYLKPIMEKIQYCRGRYYSMFLIKVNFSIASISYIFMTCWIR